MIPYFLMAAGASGFCWAIFNICNALKPGFGTSSYPDFPPDEFGVKIRSDRPSPWGNGSAEAKPEIEGNNISFIP